MDLASTPKDVSIGAKPSAPQPSYPSFSIRDDKAKEFGEAYECAVGDELTATLKLKVVGKRDDQYGNSIEFELQSIDDVVKGEGAETPAEPKEEADDEEKVLGFKRKSVVKEAPALNASDLAY